MISHKAVWGWLVYESAAPAPISISVQLEIPPSSELTLLQRLVYAILLPPAELRRAPQMITWPTAFAVDILRKLVIETVKSAWSHARRFGMPFSQARHLRELSLKVRDMPFIYKDLGGNVEHDFVDLDLQPGESPSPSRSTTLSDPRIAEPLRTRRRALILGPAGIGKTTLLRHTILHLIEAKGRSNRFLAGEYLLPFYVPLKALDNSEAHPLVRYLLSTNSYLSGWRGQRRLRTLARKRQLILFLDAYDEIPSATLGSRHFIQEELRLLLAPSTVELSQPYDRELYEALAGARIWISSRPDFFALNPLPIDSNPPSVARVRNCTTLSLRGVGSHRRTLIKIIFDKYRSRSSRYADLLSEEFFESEIDRTSDPELIELSTNPLFLTVMCYIYVKTVIDAGSHEVLWATTMPELVLECLRLLLHDLDSEKARDLPPAHRAGLLRRRNEYVGEKLAFLHYFALTLIVDGRTVFDFAHLTGALEHFVRTEASTPETPSLVRRIGSSDSMISNLASQLIYSGIFVVVDRSERSGVLQLDFPHRRFKEVLAARYLEQRPNRLEVVRQCLASRDASEFVFVYFTLTAERSEVLSIILPQTCVIDEPYFGGLALRCFQRLGVEDKTICLLREFFLTCLRTNTPFFLPADTLEFIRPDTAFCEEIVRHLRASIENRSVWSCVGAYSLLKHLDVGLLERELRPYLARTSFDSADGILRLIFEELWLPGNLGGNVQCFLGVVMSDKIALWLCAAICAAKVSSTEDRIGKVADQVKGAERLKELAGYCRKVFDASENAMIFLASMLHVRRPSLLAAVLDGYALSAVQQRRIAIARRLTDDKWIEIVNRKLGGGGGGWYVLTEAASRDAGSERGGHAAAKVQIGSVFLNVEDFRLAFDRSVKRADIEKALRTPLSRAEQHAFASDDELREILDLVRAGQESHSKTVDCFVGSRG